MRMRDVIQLEPPAAALDVVDFWHQAGPALWFAKDPAFDRQFRETFLRHHEAASLSELDDWQHSADGTLALVLLLDQFPRNAFRGSPRMYTTDPLARKITARAIVAGHDRSPPQDIQKFFYLPFAHSEDLADQDRCVALCQRLGGIDLAHAQRHRDIVQRFGRFPHRNPILGRTMRPEEQDYLDKGGYAG